jgi:hypothetical protein
MAPTRVVPRWLALGLILAMFATGCTGGESPGHTDGESSGLETGPQRSSTPSPGPSPSSSPGPRALLIATLSTDKGVFKGQRLPRIDRWTGAQAQAYRQNFRLCFTIGLRDTAIQLHTQRTVFRAALAVVKSYPTRLLKAGYEGCVDGFAWDRLS